METTQNNSLLVKWKKRFFSIWIGQAISQIGSRLVGFAFVWHLTSSYQSATILSIATLVSVLPDIIISPFAGALIDRWDRKRVLIVTDVLTAMLTLLLAILFAFTSVQLWQILVVMFLRSTFGSFQWPATLTMTSLIVPKNQLARIQGLNTTLSGVMGILSPPLGAFLVGLLPMWGVLSIDVVTALLAVIPLLFFSIPNPVPIAMDANNKTGQKPNLFKDLAAGIKYVGSLPGLFAVIIAATFINFLVTPAFSLLPILITNYFNKGVIELGIGESFFSVGFLVGGILLGIWGGFKNRLVTTMVFLIAMGASISLVGFMPSNNFYPAMVILGLAGFFNPLVNGPLMAALQSRVEPSMQGRVFTLLQSGAAMAMPLGLVIAGPVSDKVGVQLWFIIGGLSCILMAILSLSNKAIISLGVDVPQKEKPLAVNPVE